MIKFREKPELPKIDDGRLIECVKRHDFLYNTKSMDYRNLSLRQKIWSDIAVELDLYNTNFVQKRWKVLREKYSVAYRKYCLDGTIPTWIYYESCNFLEPHVSLKADKKLVKDLFLIEKPISVRKKAQLDENLLIELMKERPALYDRQHEDFRVSSVRKEAWMEIANIAGLDVITVQKRWRVMRDRFVRELRRTKKIEGEAQIECSSFFRDMLFLVRHVKAKTYEAALEGDASDALGDTSMDGWDDNVVAYGIEESEDNKDIFAADEREQDAFEGSSQMSTDYYYEEIIEDGTAESLPETAAEEATESVKFSETNIFKDIVRTTDKSEESRKRKLSEDKSEDTEQPKAKREIVKLSKSTNTHGNQPLFEDDEDAAFCRTLINFLRKFPPHIKSSIELEILQTAMDRFNQLN